MRIVVDIGHPAHVQYFKHFIKEMTDNGHEIMCFARESIQNPSFQNCPMQKEKRLKLRYGSS